MNDILECCASAAERSGSWSPHSRGHHHLLTGTSWPARSRGGWTHPETGLQPCAEAGGLREVVDRPARSHPSAVGKLIFWLVMLIVILLASAALGSRASTRCSHHDLVLPTLIAAIVIVIRHGRRRIRPKIILASAGNVEGADLANIAKGSW